MLLLAGVAYKAGFVDLRKFPKAEGAKQVTLNCTYHGQKIALEETLYQSIDEYYASDPGKKFAGYESYTESAKEDNTVRELTQKIKAKGTELGLSSDQTMDLATCFVQNIPYDSEKAKVILSENPGDKVVRATNREYADRFPYETLFDNKGICTDKSYLEAAILKEMGYGAAILTFNKEKHMAVGVKTPQGYTSFNTQYSYVETTNTGYRVGQLPLIDEGVGGAKKAELDKIQDTESSQDIIPEIPEPNFSPPSGIIKISDGKEYERIIEITAEINQLKELGTLINTRNKALVSSKNELKNSESQAQSAKDELKSAELRVDQAKRVYGQNSTDGNYDAYRREYDNYQSTYYRTKSIIDSYNVEVNDFNAKVRELNGLIDKYNTLIKND